MREGLSWIVLAAACLAMPCAAETLGGQLPAQPCLDCARRHPAGASPEGRTLTRVDGRLALIIDGDTVAFGSERVRILDIDAPETRGSRCEPELVLGLQAKMRLAALLRAGHVEIERHGQDVYGRTLARLRVNGIDIGQTLIREGLVLPWQGGPYAREARRLHWCGPSRP